MMSIIKKIFCAFISQIWTCISEDLLKQLAPSPPDVEVLRIYLTLPLYHEFNNPKRYQLLHTPFAGALLKLTYPANKVIGSWWSSINNDYFEHLVNNFKSVVMYIIRHQQIPENQARKEAQQQICFKSFISNSQFYCRQFFTTRIW